MIMIKTIYKVITAAAAMTVCMQAMAAARNSEEECVIQYVDPIIGAGGSGGVVVGPCMPFGMVKPGPDVSGAWVNSGWKPMPKEIDGFTQTHVSGTGGSPRYGNVLVMPFLEGFKDESHAALRKDETMELGYYASTLDSGIKVELTAADRAVLYHFSYPSGGTPGLEIDADYCRFGGKKGQRVLDSSIEMVSPTELRGHSTVKGGWGAGWKPYTIYFYAMLDTPAEAGVRPDKAGPRVDDQKAVSQQLNLSFAPGTSRVELKVGISFISTEIARRNILEGLAERDFEATRRNLEQSWESLLSRARIAPGSPLKLKRMFYTALYHTMLMPSCRNGEWFPDSTEPYYDDYFTIWDTYRTSFPLITVLAPERQAEIVRSLLNIYVHDGYMPDGRSGNANGSTQGSSNADIVLADAFVKDLPGIDWRLALEAMIKDAEVSPDSESREGRNGLQYYNSIGYLPWGVSRAGSRTVDHAFCDYAIYTVADGLGEKELADKYLQRSRNWENLWRDVTDENGLRGFITARDSSGRWLDEGVVDRSGKGLPDTTLVLRPETSFNHWMNYFYESNSYEASFAMPHDIARAMELSGGRDEFLRKLQTCVEKACFDGGNEPAFLHTSLFHWTGRPDLTSDVCNSKIINEYNDGPRGIPGNDDSGAMSSWMAWHMTGLYPVAGFDFYLVHSPLVSSTTFTLEGGKQFTIKAKRLSDKRRYVRSARLNGRRYPWSTIRHRDIMEGGTLVLRMGRRPGKWGAEMFRPGESQKPLEKTVMAIAAPAEGR